MEVRAARPDDYEGFTRFWDQLDLGQPAPAFAHWLEHLCPNTIFLADGDALAAYNLSFAFGTRGDVRQVVVDRAYRNRGVGKELMAAVAAKLRAAGCHDWRLEVRAENAPALALYRSVGLQRRRTIYAIGVTAAQHARFAATRSGRHTAIEVTPVDDAALETAFDLGTGQIARWRRARAPWPLLRVGTLGLTQLWQDFAPDFGLLFPFLVADVDSVDSVDVAAHLIAAAPPGPWEIDVASEAIRTALTALGATLKSSQLELAGPL